MNWISIIILFVMLTAVAIWLRQKSSQEGQTDGRKWICNTCGQVGKPRRITKGSCLIEALLWILAVIGVVEAIIWVLAAMINFALGFWFGLVDPPLLPLLILPGLIYTIWRSKSKYDVCPKCNHPSMIPVDTPAGSRLLTQQREHSVLPDDEGEQQ